MRIVSSLLAVVLVCGCAAPSGDEESPAIKIQLHDAVLKLANARLADHTAPWHRQDYEHDTIVDARFVAQDRQVLVEAGERYSHVYLYRFRVLAVVAGKFGDEELRFLRVMHFEKGVRYKLLTLRGDLRFWLKTTDDGYVVTNIERIPGRNAGETPQPETLERPGG